MASALATIYDSLNAENLLLLLLLLLMLHYLMVLYEFRNMPPGPRLTNFPVVGNLLSLNFNAGKITDGFQRSVRRLHAHFLCFLVDYRDMVSTVQLK